MVAKKRTKRIVSQQGIELPAALVEQGKAALQHRDYNAAIQAWQLACSQLAGDEAQTAPLIAALAEAYFRRGVTVTPARLDDLTEAVRLAPDEPRFQYHLALAHQRGGEWERAIALYRSLLERTPPYTRAAFPLAVALIATRQQLRSDPVWRLLSPDEQACLVCAQALYLGRAAPASPYAPRNGADALWDGLAAMAVPGHDATSCLETALDDPALPSLAAGVARHYLGVLACEVQAEKRDAMEQALAHWQAAEKSGLNTPWLHQNLANAHEALALLEIGEKSSLAGALRLAGLGLRITPDDPVLLAIQNYARLHLGYQAALTGDWMTALDHWQAVHPPYKGRGLPQAGNAERALLANMALAHEQLNHFAQAAGLWRQVIRRRPRKSGTHGALTSGQVARMWQRVAEDYSKAGDYEEAARAYRSALAHAPGDMALQMGLVEVLFGDERSTAALAVVEDMLEVQPDQVEVLAWKARLIEQSGDLRAARRAWQRVLKLDPQHGHARQSLAQFYQVEGDNYRRRGNIERAIAAYQKGLELVPGSIRLRVSLGACRGYLEDLEAARKMFDEVLNERPDDLEAHYWVAWGWLDVDDWDEAQATLKHAERLHPPSGFYLDLAEVCWLSGRTRSASRLLDLAEKHTPDDPKALVELAEVLRNHKQKERALHCLQRAIALDPDRAETYLAVARYYLPNARQARLAEGFLTQAELAARRTGAIEVLLQARLMRGVLRSR